MKNKFGIILIVRLKSKRLKKKAILKITKKNTVIEYLITKIQKGFKNKKIILSTSNLKSDIPLVKIAHKTKINSFKAEAIDVLKRIYLTAKHYRLTTIYVCTGDNPLLDIKTALKMIKIHNKGNFDFTYSQNMSLGTYGWILKFKALEKVIKIKRTKNTEIWGNFFIKNKKFKCKPYKQSFYNPEEFRLTIDEKDDLNLVRKILKLSKNKYPDLTEIIKIMKKNNKIANINSHIHQRKGPRFV